MRRFLIVVLSLFLVTPAASQSIEPLSDTVFDTLRENPISRASDAFLTQFDVSKTLVGVHLVGEDAVPLDYSKFTLGPLPSLTENNSEMEVCVSVTSLDTLYDGNVNFAVELPIRTSNTFLLRSELQDLLRKKYDSGNVIIRALLTKKCRSQNEGFLVAAGLDPNPTHLEVIHAAKAASLMLSLIDVDGEIFNPSECHEIETPPGQRCRFALTDLTPGDYELKSEILHVAHPDPIIRSVKIAVPKSAWSDD